MIVKKESLAQMLPINFAKFLKRPFFTELFLWLLLNFNSTTLKRRQALQFNSTVQ